jgi:predicted RNA binding protein YcfA (HicA-like mRNA interferase family)
MSIIPILSAREVVRKLLRGGFASIHQRGSHVKLRHHATGRTVTIPMHSRDLGRRTIASIIKQSGLSVEEFLKL